MSRSETLTGLIKWAGRAEWQDRFSDVLDEHLGDACEAWDIDEENSTRSSETIEPRSCGAARSRIFSRDMMARTKTARISSRTT